jgi:hypothetical protein
VKKAPRNKLAAAMLRYGPATREYIDGVADFLDPPAGLPGRPSGHRLDDKRLWVHRYVSDIRALGRPAQAIELLKSVWGAMARDAPGSPIRGYGQEHLKRFKELEPQIRSELRPRRKKRDNK